MSSDPAKKIRICAIDQSTRSAVMAFFTALHGRRHSPEFLDWRFAQCPVMEGLAAMVGDECIATMFAMRRAYQTDEGRRECLEPFEWHANEDWRAQAPGLRIVKHYMKDSRPLVGAPGTDAASGLLERLRWPRVSFAERYVLPLTGRFLAHRGRSALVTRAFDVIGRPVFRPRARRSPLSLAPASSYADHLAELASAQRHFSLMRLPDPAMLQWLQRAPAPVGQYMVLHARVGDELAGWVTTRVYARGGVRIGELLEVFLADRHRARTLDLVSAASVMLADLRTDALIVTTTCAETITALRRLRYRIDARSPVHVWSGGAPVSTRNVLVDGALGDHAFFPLPSAEEAAWLERAPTLLRT